MLHVRVGKGQYVDGGAELDRYQRLSRELAAVQLKLDDAVTGVPSAAELPAHLERAAAERDHLAAISRRTHTPDQRHALVRAERRVPELAAAEAPRSDVRPWRTPRADIGMIRRRRSAREDPVGF